MSGFENRCDEIDAVPQKLAELPLQPRELKQPDGTIEFDEQVDVAVVPTKPRSERKTQKPVALSQIRRAYVNLGTSAARSGTRGVMCAHRDLSLQGRMRLRGLPGRAETSQSL